MARVTHCDASLDYTVNYITVGARRIKAGFEAARLEPKPLARCLNSFSRSFDAS